MKAPLILAGIAISFGYSAFPTSACEYPCRNYYKSCLMTAEGTPSQCKMLYLASTKDGGVWGSAKARAESKTTGQEIYCKVDFE